MGNAVDRGKSRVNFASYPQDYYTGAQVKIYLGSIWVDDIATISYTTSHSKTPLYGYADHQFRAVAKGQFLVRGSFTVAFKETGYLYEIIQMWRNDLATPYSITNADSKSTKTNFLSQIQAGTTIEDAMDVAAGKQDFEDAAEVMEDIIWGKVDGTVIDGNSNGNRIPRSDEMDYYQYQDKNQGGNSDIDRDSFDILITFGDYRLGQDSAEHTMVSINGIHITGESMIMSPTAEPIGVSYEFFARGLNERVSNAWPTTDIKNAQKAREDKQTKQQNDAAKAAAASQKASTDNTTGAVPLSIDQVPDRANPVDSRDPQLNALINQALPALKNVITYMNSVNVTFQTPGMEGTDNITYTVDTNGVSSNGSPKIFQKGQRYSFKWTKEDLNFIYNMWNNQTDSNTWTIDNVKALLFKLFADETFWKHVDYVAANVSQPTNVPPITPTNSPGFIGLLDKISPWLKNLSG